MAKEDQSAMKRPSAPDQARVNTGRAASPLDKRFSGPSLPFLD
jgi:hypothetical protein